MKDVDLPLGHYTLPDGREVYGMNAFELSAFIRDANRKQYLADVHLARELDRNRKSVPQPPGRVQLEIFGD